MHSARNLMFLVATREDKKAPNMMTKKNIYYQMENTMSPDFNKQLDWVVIRKIQTLGTSLTGRY